MYAITDTFVTMRNILYIALSAAVICACGNKEQNIEEEARQMLDTARQQMYAQNYNAAKDTVLSMRKRFPGAFEARTEGIIVMDSIELLEAQDSLAIIDTLLKKEQIILEQLQAVKNKNNLEERSQQNLKVFHIRQHFDEMGAKVKFFLRKIEIDKAEQQNNSKR